MANRHTSNRHTSNRHTSNRPTSTQHRAGQQSAGQQSGSQQPSTWGPSTLARAEQLRSRARVLRQFAAQLDHCLALRLPDHAGPDTWHSPRADLCRWVLGINCSQLGRSIDELRWNAHRLDEQALELEAAARIVPIG